MDSSKIGEVALKLTWQDMSMIAIKYMGIEVDELDNMWIESKKDIQAYNHAVITFWKRKIADPALDTTEVCTGHLISMYKFAPCYCLLISNKMILEYVIK